MVANLVIKDLPEAHPARQLAKQQSWEFLDELDFKLFPSLFFENDKLCLHWREAKNTNDSFAVDFLEKSSLHSLRTTMHGPQIFKSALGTHGRRVLDMTGGFAADALLMSVWEYEVTALEENPIVFALTADALRRVKSVEEGDVALKVKDKVSKYLGYQLKNSFEYEPEDTFDIVYIDPMFPEKKTKALSPKPMQVLQSLEVGTQHVEKYLEKARSFGAERIIVKRPASAPVALGKNTHSFKGKSVRYDMYDKNFFN